MTLDFTDGVGARHFEFCFVGFVLGGSLQEKKGISLLRTELALFTKLEGISVLKPCGKKLVNGEPERQLKADGGALDVTAPEFDVLYAYLAQVPWQSGTPVKHAVETLDWLEASSRGGAHG